MHKYINDVVLWGKIDVLKKKLPPQNKYDKYKQCHKPNPNRLN